MTAAPLESRPADRRKLLLGGAAVLISIPVLGYVATRPLGVGNAGITGTGGAAKGVAPHVDFEAPNFKLKDPTTGKEIQLRDYRGKPVLLNFWATWCVPCREEMPELEEVYRGHKGNGLVVLAVSVDDERVAKDIPEFLKAGDPRVGAYSFPVVVDGKQEVLKQYKLLGVPQSYFIDAAGVIRVVQPRVMNRQMMEDGIKLILP